MKQIDHHRTFDIFIVVKYLSFGFVHIVAVHFIAEQKGKHLNRTHSVYQTSNTPLIIQ